MPQASCDTAKNYFLYKIPNKNHDCGCSPPQRCAGYCVWTFALVSWIFTGLGVTLLIVYGILQPTIVRPWQEHPLANDPKIIALMAKDHFPHHVTFNYADYNLDPFTFALNVTGYDFYACKEMKFIQITKSSSLGFSIEWNGGTSAYVVSSSDDQMRAFFDGAESSYTTNPRSCSAKILKDLVVTSTQKVDLTFDATDVGFKICGGSGKNRVCNNNCQSAQTPGFVNPHIVGIPKSTVAVLDPVHLQFVSSKREEVERQTALLISGIVFGAIGLFVFIYEIVRCGMSRCTPQACFPCFFCSCEPDYTMPAERVPVINEYKL